MLNLLEDTKIALIVVDRLDRTRIFLLPKSLLDPNRLGQSLTWKHGASVDPLMASSGTRVSEGCSWMGFKMDENDEGRENYDGEKAGRDLSASHEEWSMKMRSFQTDARIQLRDRNVSREEVTARVKHGRSDSTL